MNTLGTRLCAGLLVIGLGTAALAQATKLNGITLKGPALKAYKTQLREGGGDYKPTLTRAKNGKVAILELDSDGGTYKDVLLLNKKGNSATKVLRSSAVGESD
jgi:hypothetical protein